MKYEALRILETSASKKQTVDLWGIDDVLVESGLVREMLIMTLINLKALNIS